jgi:hypothetical protein
MSLELTGRVFKCPHLRAEYVFPLAFPSGLSIYVCSRFTVGVASSMGSTCKTRKGEGGAASSDSGCERTVSLGLPGAPFRQSDHNWVWGCYICIYIV